MPTPGVDFFRVDRSGPTKRRLIVAGVLVTLGGSVVGAHLVSRLGPSLGRVLSLAGGLTMMTGLVLGFGAMALMLFENIYIVIRDDGVLLHDNDDEIVIAWAELEGVDVEPFGALAFRRRDAEPVRWFGGAVAHDIRARVEDARRKAAHGILRISR